MRHARERIELDVVAGRDGAQGPFGSLAQTRHGIKVLFEFSNGCARRAEQLAHLCIALCVGCLLTALFHCLQSVLQSADQKIASLGVVEQVILQIGVALHHPDVAQHFIEHAGGAAGASLLAQLFEQFPGPGTEQTQDDFAVRKRRVVVGDFTQP